MNEILTRFERVAPPGSNLPVLILPTRHGQPLTEATRALRDQIDEAMLTTGGVLFRDFLVPSVDAFQEFAASFGNPLLKYEFASTPRSAVASSAGTGIYTSTEYPAHQTIPLHNEQSYTREWPMHIWFHCVTAAPSGGETPIADSRAIFKRMPEHIIRKFSPGVLYVRNYGDFDVSWQKVFNTEDRAEVEAFCQRAGIQWEWKADGELRTTQLCQAVEAHPVTGEKVWFNQANLFHVSNLQSEVRESLEDLLGAENMPRNVYYANGAVIEDDTLAEIRSVLDSETVSFRWQDGDVMMLDNMLIAHSRSPFEGPRKVVVAMAKPHGNLGKF